MNGYETMLVVSSKISEKEVEELLGKLQKVIQEQKGELVSKNSLGKKVLLFPMKKEKEGYYVQMGFKGPGGLVKELETLLRYDERVLRFMTTKE